MKSMIAPLPGLPPPPVPLALAGTPPAVPLVIRETGGIIHADTAGNGIETEGVSLGHVCHQVIEKQAFDPPIPAIPPYSMDDVKAVHIDIKKAKEQTAARNPDGSIARYTADVPDPTNPLKILHKKGDLIQQNSMEFKTWEHNGRLYVALPIVCSLDIERGSEKQTVQVEQLYYTTIEAPIEPCSDYEKEAFKNKLQITVIKMREELRLDRLKMDADIETPTTITTLVRSDEVHVSTCGFTHESNKAWFFGKHKRTRKEWKRLDEYEFLGVPLSYGGSPATLATVRSTDYQAEYVTDAPGHRHERADEFTMATFTCTGPTKTTETQLRDVENIQNQLREACLALAKKPSDRTAKSAVEKALGDLASHIAPPPNSPLEITLQKEMNFALDTIESLAETMQSTFESAEFNKTTNETEYHLKSTEKDARGNPIPQIKDFVEAYQNAAVEYDALNAEITFREQPDYKALEKNSKALDTATKRLQQVKEEINQCQKKIDEARTSTPPKDTAALESNKTTLTTEQQQLTEQITKLTQEKSDLEAQYHTTFEVLMKNRNPKYADKNAGELEKMRNEAQGEVDYNHNLLAERLALLQTKHAALKEALTVCRTLQGLYQVSKPDPEIKKLAESLEDAVSCCNFEKMEQAIESFSRQVAERPLSRDRVPLSFTPISS